jgi:Glycosyl hydrolases family 6
MSTGTSRRLLLGGLLLVLALGATVGVASASSSPTRGPRAFVVHPGQQLCPEPYSATRNPANPLDLPHDPGGDPLNGARFFVDGPRHGEAASATARLLGINPNRYPESYSWAAFENDLSHGRLHRKLRGHPSLAYAVHLLEKIASQPETERMSPWSEGGGPGAIYDETQKILCGTMSADPGSVPVFNTYFLYQAGYCESAGTIRAHRGTFERQVSEMAQAIDRRPAVILAEMDAVGSSPCMARNGGLGEWEANIRYELGRFAALPHTVVYIEGGYSDAASAGYTARVLRAVGVRGIRGFYTNDTHLNWTRKEIRWGEKVARLAGGTHFIVNTSDSGKGPLLNAHPATQGVEDLCNPPGRGAGPRPTTDTGFPNVDAYLWVHVPGESSGHCNGGTAAGTFWLARTLVEARNANGRLGPRMRSKPY